jgi:hypothetical protein
MLLPVHIAKLESECKKVAICRVFVCKLQYQRGCWSEENSLRLISEKASNLMCIWYLIEIPFFLATDIKVLPNISQFLQFWR